ncbi:uncharacterized protein N7482_007063 [Penicillium canariense]|uniref:Uncharacterized protein n=1 Tax=Penicillium canariense TaxID=189055 RepID=A0A9W9HXF4_9EURO|nr:uncharacterized protein N7482_007063 [Penicillium canariense]KAJ5160059.1 hypothetical protein N7482_007063 [Penicillium canariense]
MAPPIEVSQVSEPSRAQLALALAIVKQKPPGTAVKDYILQFRKCIKQVEENSIIVSNKFLDSVAFWQTAYKKSEAEQTKLLNTIYELEQRNESLLTKLHMDPTTSDSKKIPATKRKAFCEVVNGSDASRKRGKRSPPTTQSQKDPAAQGNEIEHDQGIAFTGQIFALQRALQKRRKSSLLAIDAVILCKEAETELLNAIQRDILLATQSKISQPQQTKWPGLIAVLNAVELSFQLVRQALHKIPSSANEKQHKNQIVYYMVCLFESTMTGLTQHCTARSKEKDTENGVPISTKTTRPSVNGSNSGKHLPSAKGDTASLLVAMLCKTALSLDLARQDDQEVMEGFLYIVLNRVGKMLALFVFNRLQLPSVVCPKMGTPEGLAVMREEALSPQHAQLEARHLICFLNRVLSGGPLCSDASPVQAQFVRKVKTQLQKSLLKAVFGDADPLFQNGLVRPATPPPQDHDGRRRDRPVFSEWFTQELWRLVGWDLLGSTISPS